MVSIWTLSASWWCPPGHCLLANSAHDPDLTLFDTSGTSGFKCTAEIHIVVQMKVSRKVEHP